MYSLERIFPLENSFCNGQDRQSIFSQLQSRKPTSPSRSNENAATVIRDLSPFALCDVGR